MNPSTISLRYNFETSKFSTPKSSNKPKLCDYYILGFQGGGWKIQSQQRQRCFNQRSGISRMFRFSQTQLTPRFQPRCTETLNPPRVTTAQPWLIYPSHITVPRSATERLHAKRIIFFQWPHLTTASVKGLSVSHLLASMTKCVTLPACPS